MYSASLLVSSSNLSFVNCVTPFQYSGAFLSELNSRPIAASKAESEFPEGKEKEVRHKAHERNTAQVQKAKANYIQKNGAVCQICGFDFKKVYGDVGAEYIEAHHTIPVSEMKESDITKVKDLAFVCANCHRMLHRRRPWLSIDELSMLIEKE